MSSTMYASAKEVREEIIGDRARNGYTLIEAKTHGSNTWIAYVDPTGVKHIELAVIRNVGGGETSYKVIAESAGPGHYDCPLHFLEIVPAPSSESAREWRAEVRARAERKRRARALLSKRGVRIKVFGGTYTTTGYTHGRSWVVRAENGGLTKLPPRYVEHVKLA